MAKWLLTKLDRLIHRAIPVPCNRKHWQPFVSANGTTSTMPGEVRYHVSSSTWG